MFIKIDAALENMTVSADGLELPGMLGIDTDDTPVEVWSVKNPLLLTDTWEIAQQDGPMRDLLHSLYASYPRTVSYDDVEVSWSPSIYPRVWCPSIDTVWMAKNIKPFLPDVKRFAEIGTGSGYLAKFAHHHGDLEDIWITDINPYAIACARDNIGDKAPVVSVQVTPDSNTLGLRDKYDLIICNPPYIPRPGEKIDNPYEGLALIEKIAKEIDLHLAPDGKMLINLSSVAGDEVVDLFPGAHLLDTFRVPLKVNVVTNGVSEQSREWLSYLVDNKLVEVEAGPGHKYWHTLRLYSWDGHR